MKTSLLAICLAAAAALALPRPASASVVVLYDNLPSTLPPNLSSWNFNTTSTREFGSLIRPAATGTFDLTGTIALSNWGWASEFGQLGISSGFNALLTLALYSVGPGNVVGPAFATETVSAFVAWRPEPTPATCAPGSNSNYLGADGQCYAGSTSLVNFDFGPVTVPGQLIYGLSYNTQQSGYAPTGTAGPIDGLNVGLPDLVSSLSVGENPLGLDAAYLSATDPAFYADLGAGGSAFRLDALWSPYGGAAFELQGSPVPEPGSILLVTTGVIGLALAARRRSCEQRLVSAFRRVALARFSRS